MCSKNDHSNFALSPLRRFLEKKCLKGRHDLLVEADVSLEQFWPQINAEKLLPTAIQNEPDIPVQVLTILLSRLGVQYRLTVVYIRKFTFVSDPFWKFWALADFSKLLFPMKLSPPCIKKYLLLAMCQYGYGYVPITA